MNEDLVKEIAPLISRARTICDKYGQLREDLELLRDKAQRYNNSLPLLPQNNRKMLAEIVVKDFEEALDSLTNIAVDYHLENALRTLRALTTATIALRGRPSLDD